MFLSILNETEKENFLNLLINTAKIDGDFSADEKLKIQGYVNEMAISLEDFSSYTKSNEELISSFQNSSDAVKRVATLELVALSLADGLFHEKENQLIDQMVSKLGLPQDFKGHLVNWYGKITPLYQQGFELVGLAGGAQ